MNAFDPNAAARADSGVFGLGTSAAAARVILLPVPFDATTSYHRGAARGPAAILAASRQVDLFDIETGRPYLAGIHMLPESDEIRAWNEQAVAAAAPIIAAGGAIGEKDAGLRAGLALVNDLGERVARQVEELTRELLGRDQIVGVIGGDHWVPLGAIAAHAERFPGLGILHIDAHADLRRAYEGFSHSHASIMDNVLTRLPQVARLVQVGIRDLCEEEFERIAQSRGRVVTFYASELWRARHDGEPWARLCDQIVAQLPQDVYVSFDIDGLDPTLCPHTGTPVPGGLEFQDISTLLRALVRSHRRIVGFDLTEVAPGPAGPATDAADAADALDDWDGNVGARVLYKLIGFTLLSRPQSQ